MSAKTKAILVGFFIVAVTTIGFVLMITNGGASDSNTTDDKFVEITQKLYPHEDGETLLQAAHWVCQKMSQGSLSGVLVGNIRDNHWDSSEVGQRPGDIYGEGNAEDFCFPVRACLLPAIQVLA